MRRPFLERKIGIGKLRERKILSRERHFAFAVLVGYMVNERNLGTIYA